MSEEGWRSFLRADGVDDWVVLHGGATAFFGTTSLAEAGRLAMAISSIPGLASRGAILAVSDTGLAVRLTRDLWELDGEHIKLARAASEVAQAHDAHADRSRLQEVQIAVAAKPGKVDVGFWRSVLGYAEMAGDNGIDPLGLSSTVWMQNLPDAKALEHAIHIDVSVPRDQVDARLASAIAAGGRIVDASHAPSHWTLSDTAGNRVCICAWPDGGAMED